MLRAKSAFGARQRDVQRFAFASECGNLVLRLFEGGFDRLADFVLTLADLRFQLAGSGLQPGVVSRRDEAILAAHPAIAQRL